MADREGFEPSIRENPYAGFRDQCLQPLDHLSEQLLVMLEILFSRWNLEKVRGRRPWLVNGRIDGSGRACQRPRTSSDAKCFSCEGALVRDPAFF